ncbi:hypothetical protein SpCBS45565_g02740 [Spizellomyces sp. 'palustris']|nr:hypothetical protein SpCBS45565_g02740 [Spizellomyces sp. 'palustris']
MDVSSSRVGRAFLVGSSPANSYFHQSAILSQIGEHRPGLRIRGDHWVPFAVLTGVKRPETLQAIQAHVVKKVSKDPIGHYRLPLPETKRNPFVPRPPRAKNPFAQKAQKPVQRVDPLAPWTVPEDVKAKVIDLCKTLTLNPAVKAEVESSLSAPIIGEAIAGEEASAEHGDSMVTSDYELGQYTIWWERDQYRYLVEESAEGLVWPEFVEHRKLKLIRNRYPAVPGFDVKALDDAASLGAAQPQVLV